jgi:hypothetical protein
MEHGNSLPLLRLEGQPISNRGAGTPNSGRGSFAATA